MTQETRVGHIIEGGLIATGLKVAIVAARWNDFVGDKLVAGAQDTLIRHGVRSQDIDLVRVPGCFELALPLAQLAQSGRYDALIALGVVIRGATAHFDYVAGESAQAVVRTVTAHHIPVSFGVVTVDTIEQAIERAGSKAGNKGAEAAAVAIEMANLSKAIQAHIHPEGEP